MGKREREWFVNNGLMVYVCVCEMAKSQVFYTASDLFAFHFSLPRKYFFLNFVIVSACFILFIIQFALINSKVYLMCLVKLKLFLNS